jgi:hypothetical protein
VRVGDERPEHDCGQHGGPSHAMTLEGAAF